MKARLGFNKKFCLAMIYRILSAKYRYSVGYVQQKNRLSILLFFTAVVTFGFLGVLMNLSYVVHNADIILMTQNKHAQRNFEHRRILNVTDDIVPSLATDQNDDEKFPFDDSFYDDRVDDMNPKLQPMFIDQGNTSKETSPVYLSYNESFSYPMDIDLEKLVHDLILFKQRIPYRHINPHPYTFIHSPPKCKFVNPKGEKTILVLVKSAVRHIELRVALRTMWRDMQDPLMRRVFLLGYDGPSQVLVDEEFRHYNDLVQENFLDAYMNNTIKTIMAYNWAVKYCGDADMLLFLDDDYHVKLREMAYYIRQVARKQPSGVFFGSTAYDAAPERALISKWHVTFSDYPFDAFPPYVAGGAYLISKDVARKFKVGFPYVKYLGIDDVYLGIIAKKLSISPTNDGHFSSTAAESLAKECSHDPAELVQQRCRISDRKRNLRYTNSATLANKINNQFIYNETFAYPLMLNFSAVVNDKILRNKNPEVKPINVHRYIYLHRPNKCSFLQTSNKVKNILVLVKSQASNVDERLFMRSLWLNVKDFNMKRIFLLGFGKSTQALVDEESRKYRDILQEDFQDNFMNSTLKTIMGYNWASKFCTQADYLIFIKAGYRVDLNKTALYLRNILPKKEKSGVFRGRTIKNSIPTRDPDSRLYLSREQYPMKNFPPYLNEIFYVVSADVAWKFQIAFPFVRYFGRSDIYLGFVARKLHILPVDDRIFADPPKLELARECPERAVAKVTSKNCKSTNELLISNRTPDKIKLIRKEELKGLKLPILTVDME